jgi:hypothetical protein
MATRSLQHDSLRIGAAVSPPAGAPETPAVETDAKLYMSAASLGRLLSASRAQAKEIRSQPFLRPAVSSVDEKENERKRADQAGLRVEAST